VRLGNRGLLSRVEGATLSSLPTATSSRVVRGLAAIALVLLAIPYATCVASAAAQALTFPEAPARTADPDHLSEFARGAAAASADLAQGHLIIKGVKPTYADFALLVKQRYGVQVEELPSCALGFSPSFALGYNSVSRPAIRSRLGTDSFPECWYETQERLKANSKCCPPA
jgi:hypothetical protein